MLSKFKILVGILAVGIPSYAFATLSCSITTAAACTGTVVLRMSGSSNAHAELPSQSNSNYASNVICCSGSQTLGTSCSGTFATILALQSTTNSHVQQNNQSGYTNNACISVPGGTVSIAYQSSNCTGYDTTLASISGASNAHIGVPSAYTTKVCGSEAQTVAQYLTFSVLSSTSTAFSGSIFFGTLSSGQTTYASSTGQGDSTQVTAHTLLANTNAANGYTITVQGATLTSGSNTITALSSNTAPSPGSSQFGIRLTASGGTGSVTSPYSGSGFAYTGTASTPAQVASESTGDNATTTYSVQYMANIAGTTAAGTYTGTYTYVITASF